MKMDEEQVKRHHPFCVHLYNTNRKTFWSCQCEMLKEYDKWKNRGNYHDVDEFYKE